MNGFSSYSLYDRTSPWMTDFQIPPEFTSCIKSVSKSHNTLGQLLIKLIRRPLNTILNSVSTKLQVQVGPHVASGVQPVSTLNGLYCATEVHDLSCQAVNHDSCLGLEHWPALLSRPISSLRSEESLMLFSTTKGVLCSPALNCVIDAPYNPKVHSAVTLANIPHMVEL
jgi:hypothetical protein